MSHQHDNNIFPPLHGPRQNEHRICQLRDEEELPQYRSRTARLEKWKELVVQASKQLEIPPAVPDRLMKLGLFVFCRAGRF